MLKEKPISSLYADLVKVSGVFNDPKPLNTAALAVQDQARALAHGGRYTTGHLANSIMIAFTEEPNQRTAHIGTNVEYAIYVEFGTGPKGQANHAGISPDVKPTYRQSPWWIHESQVDSEAARVYHWFFVETDQGRFYRVTGQPARPFLYPAVHNQEKRIANLLEGAYQKEIRRRVK